MKLTIVVLLLMLMPLALALGSVSEQINAEGFTGEILQSRGLKEPKVDSINIGFMPGVSEQKKNALIRSNRDKVSGRIPEINVVTVRIPRGQTAERVISRYERHPLVEFAEPNHFSSPADTFPNDPYWPSLWHLRQLGAPQAWDITTGNTNLILAILDTGFDPEHPEFQGKMLPGRNTYADNDDIYSPCCGHGSHVASFAAANTNNNYQTASVCWGCRILPIQIVTPLGGATDSTTSEGIIWAADHGARVASISFTSCLMVQSNTVQAAMQYLYNRNGLTVFATGNQAGYFCDIPDDPKVIIVSATRPDGQWATWSSIGNYVDIAAPGESLRSICPVGSESSSCGGSGTSFSTPQVSATLALMMSANPDLTPAELTEIITQTAVDVGPPGWDNMTGWGRLNTYQAVLTASNAQAVPDTTPPGVSFVYPTNGSDVAGDIIVQIGATDNILVTQVRLFIDGSLVGNDLTSPFEFSLASGDYPNGAHMLTAEANDFAGNIGSASININIVNQVCGDGVVNGNEQCDDGNTNNGDGCSSACTIEAVCGDGITNGNEVCDGNIISCTTNDGHSGMQTCTLQCDGYGICIADEFCGDGIINGNEQCDDGNTNNGDGCSSSCIFEGCILGTDSWQNTPFTPQTEEFIARFNVRPSANGLNSMIGLSKGSQTRESKFAAMIRFRNGVIQVKDRNTYKSDVAGGYAFTGQQTYSFEVNVNMLTDKYSVYVTKDGVRTTLATNYSFIRSQANVDQLNNAGFIAEAFNAQLCGFEVI